MLSSSGKQRRDSVEDGINFFRRSSIVSVASDGNDVPRTSSTLVFAGKADFDPSEPEEELDARDTNQRLSSHSALLMPSQGMISISTAFVGVFLLFATLLGVSLMIVSADFSANSNELASHGTNTVQEIYVGLVNETNVRWIEAAGYSVSALTELVSQQVNQRIETGVRSFTAWCEFCVTQMADMTRSGELDVIDMDYTIEKLWRLYQEFPNVTDMIFAGAEHGNWIVMLNTLQTLPYVLLVRNPPGTICLACSMGPSNATKLYHANNVSNLMSWQATGRSSPMDPRSRIWYQMAVELVSSVEGKGSGRWTSPYAFAVDNLIGVTASKVVQDKNGKVLGVVAADFSLQNLTSFLQGLKADVDVHEESDDVLPEGGIQLAILHPSGILLATSSGISLPLAKWNQVLNASQSMLRTGIQVVSDSCGGDWSSFFINKSLQRFHKFTNRNLFIMMKPVSDDWGLKMILFSVVPVAEYREKMDIQINATMDKLASEAQKDSDTIKSVKRQVDANVKRNWVIQLVLSLVILLVGSVIVFGFATRISRTLRTLAEEMQMVAMLDFSERSMYQSKYVDEVIAISRSFAIMDMNLLSFSRYVPEKVVRLLSRKGTVAHLGVAPREVSIMFSDIAGFTTLAEQLAPESLIAILAEYLEAMSDCIETSGGTVGKFIGDAIMAFWNSPTKVHDHANVACASALMQQQRLNELRDKWILQGYPPLHMRLGLSTGTVLHGNVGPSKRMEWTLIGDEVNLASRLEAMGKYYGVTILISGAMHTLVHHRFLARPVDRVVAVGKTRSVDVYELVAERAVATPEQLRFCAEFEAVVTAYRRREFEVARGLAEAFDKAFPGDITAGKYVDRCSRFLEAPPPEDWDGTTVLTSK